MHVYFCAFNVTLTCLSLQIIQRQLEQVEEKQRQLEERGVAVEKALRGEAGKNLSLIRSCIVFISFFLINLTIPCGSVYQKCYSRLDPTTIFSALKGVISFITLLLSTFNMWFIVRMTITSCFCVCCSPTPALWEHVLCDMGSAFSRAPKGIITTSMISMMQHRIALPQQAVPARSLQLCRNHWLHLPFIW